MKIVELDVSNCYNLYELHERIRNAFDFPEWYGKNWDAFWDMMWSECTADKLIIKGEHTLAPVFDKHLAIMHEILERSKKNSEERGYQPFTYEIID